MTQDTIKQRLRAARALIDKPEKWTQLAFERDAEGNSVDGTGAEVVARCASRAINEACVFGEGFEVRRYLRDAMGRLQDVFFTLSGWNDEPDRTHAEVMQAFDRAIEEVSAPSVAGIPVLNDRLDSHLKELKALDRAIEYK